MNYPNDPDGAKRAAGASKGYYIHLAVYVAVNAMLVAINLTLTPERLWFRWPLLGWGVGVVAHAVVTFAVTRDRTPRGG